MDAKRDPVYLCNTRERETFIKACHYVHPLLNELLFGCIFVYSIYLFVYYLFVCSSVISVKVVCSSVWYLGVPVSHRRPHPRTQERSGPELESVWAQSLPAVRPPGRLSPIPRGHLKALPLLRLEPPSRKPRSAPSAAITPAPELDLPS